LKGARLYLSKTIKSQERKLKISSQIVEFPRWPYTLAGSPTDKTRQLL